MGLIVVLGLPSGGTSVVAGMLHHLGVDMGALPTVEYQRSIPGTRNYYAFECMNLTRLMNRAQNLDDWFNRVQRYVEKRLARETGPLGVKCNRMAFLGDHAKVTELPIDVVHVHRRLEDVFASDYKHTQSLNRAAMLGSLYGCMQRFIERVPPRISLDFDDILSRRYAVAQELSDALGLERPRSTVLTAGDSVDPATRGKFAA